jgi:hypothetical protein
VIAGGGVAAHKTQGVCQQTVDSHTLSHVKLVRRTTHPHNTP